MRPRTLPRASVVLALVLSALALPGRTPARAAAPDLSAYQGLGAWVDLYDPHLLAKPEGTVANLSRRGVRTLFLETSNYQMPHAVMNQVSVGRYLDAAHARGMEVVAWYVPGFMDLEMDFQRTMAAIRFRSGTGQMFDGFGMDIESTRVPQYWERNRRTIELSNRVRAAVGPGYALGAITLPTPLLDDSPNYWPAFPFKELARIYDVFLPMGYWTYRYGGHDGAYWFTRASIEGIRQRTGRPAIPIHPIGGIADAVDASTARGFVHAVRDHGSIGASFYDVGTSTEEDWAALAEVGVSPVQDPVMPFALGKRFGEYGNLAAGDTTHPRDVVFVTDKHAGTWELDYEVFGPESVSVWINWTKVATLSSSPLGWSDTRTLTLPPGTLPRQRNTVMFTAGEAAAPAAQWGVRRVSLVPGPLAASDRSAHGNIPGRESARADRVTYALPATAGLATVTAAGFDVDAGEVMVQVNGRPLGLLAPTGPNAWGAPQTFVIPPDLLGRGSHRLTFDAVNFPPERSVWGVRLMDASGLSVMPGL